MNFRPSINKHHHGWRLHVGTPGGGGGVPPGAGGGPRDAAGAHLRVSAVLHDHRPAPAPAAQPDGDTDRSAQNVLDK